MKGYDALIGLLDAAGVETVFALTSDDTLQLMSALAAAPIGVRTVRHEQAAVAMADGYARAGGDVGVCIVGRGPAVAQTGTALVTARKKGSDVLLVVPEPSRSDAYDIKAFDQEAYLRSTVGTVTRAGSHATLVEVFSDALRRVAAGEGPLAVTVPRDVLDGELESVPETLPETVDGGDPARTAAPGRVHPDDASVEAAVELYVDSDAFQPPVVLAGRGAVRAGAKEAIEAFAERTTAVLATSLQARDYFADHPFSLGVAGKWGSNLANRYLGESHLVLAVGASLNPYTVDEGHVFGDDTRVIQVDSDPAALGRHAEVDLGIHGDARVTVESMVAELDRRGIDREGALWTDDRREEIAAAATMNDRSFPDVPGTVDPRDLVRALDDLLPADRTLVTDGGHFTRWVVDGIRADPTDFLFSLDFASIGLGLPMGIGAAEAAGDADNATVAVCGDAGFLMSVGELDTAVRNDVPLTVVVMNDGALGSEYHNLAAVGADPSVARVRAPDFADVAEAFGAEGHTVRSIAELEGLADRLGRPPEGPLVVDCKVNHEVRHRSKM